MKRIVFPIIFCFCFIASSAQETISKQLSNIWHLYDELKFEEAYSAVNAIESQCLKSNNDTIMSQFYCYKGWGLFHTKHYEECIPYLKHACSLFEKTNNRYQDYLDCYSLIALASAYIQDYSEAERYFRKTIIKSHSAYTNDNFFLINNYYINLASIYNILGDSIMAKECHNTINARLEYANWKNSIYDSIEKYNNLYQYDIANEYRKALSDAILFSEGYTQEYFTSEYNRGLTLLSKQSIPESKLIFENIIYHYPQLNIILNEDVCGAYCYYCQCLAAEGDFDQIEKIIPDAIKYINYTNSKTYPTSTIYRCIGDGAYSSNNFPNAIKYYEEYLAAKHERELGNGYDRTISRLSTAYIFSGKNTNGISILKKYLKKNEKRLKQTDPSLLSDIYTDLGGALTLEKQYKNALKYLNESKKIQIELTGNVSDITQRFIDICTDLK